MCCSGSKVVIVADSDCSRMWQLVCAEGFSECWQALGSVQCAHAGIGNGVTVSCSG